MESVRIETIVDEQGEVHLPKLPFPAGQKVEVTVSPRPSSQGTDFPLRGLPLKYDRPTDPVADSDWDSLR